MTTTHQVHNISISIERDPAAVYDYASLPENFPRWALGLAMSIEPEGDHWLATTSEGPVQVHFTPRNEYGILDHHVTTAGGVDVYVPMRVIENGSGSEVIFTLFRTSGMSDENLARDAAQVERDLEALKTLLE